MSITKIRYAQFASGDMAPYFSACCTNNPDFSFESVAGRYIVLSFLGSAAQAKSSEVIQAITGKFRDFFDDKKYIFFGVTTNPADIQEGRIKQMLPGIRYFLDYDSAVSRLYKVIEQRADGVDVYWPFTLVLDPMLRVLHLIPLMDAAEHNHKLEQILSTLPPVDYYGGVKMTAPVLIVPRVFEPELCRDLIGLYNRDGGVDSGFMRNDEQGRTVGVLDYGFKRRRDYNLDSDPEGNREIKALIRNRISRHLLPQIKKAFNFSVTHLERYIVARYDGNDGGHFQPHKDNTTKGTAHRIFAVTMNLNAGEYEGGDLRFPEFGTEAYRAPTGGAVVFSCSLLHEARPVTKGVRYAFLPFLYDDNGARIRAQNMSSIIPRAKTPEEVEAEQTLQQQVDAESNTAHGKP